MMKQENLFKNQTVPNFLKVYNLGPPFPNKFGEKVIEQIDNNTCVIQLFLVPPLSTIMSTREMLIKRSILKLEDGSTLICFESCEHPDVPLNPKVIRSSMYKNIKI